MQPRPCGHTGHGARASARRVKTPHNGDHHRHVDDRKDQASHPQREERVVPFKLELISAHQLATSAHASGRAGTERPSQPTQPGPSLTKLEAANNGAMPATSDSRPKQPVTLGRYPCCGQEDPDAHARGLTCGRRLHCHLLLVFLFGCSSAFPHSNRTAGALPVPVDVRQQDRQEDGPPHEVLRGAHLACAQSPYP